MTGSLLFGSAVTQEHGAIVTSNDSAHQTAHPASPGERPGFGLSDLDLTPQGLADAPASETDPDSLVYTGNS